MLPDLKEIKKLRKKYSISQKDLALKSAVSQSLIAKIESNKIEPTYFKTKRIFEALEELRDTHELKAKDLMNKSIFFVDANDNITSVVQLMKSESISQIPVRSKEKILGIINEKIILDNIIENKNKINYLKIGDIMGDCPPIVSINCKQRILLELLKDNQLILISNSGEIVGLVTKSDLLDIF